MLEHQNAISAMDRRLGFLDNDQDIPAIELFLSWRLGTDRRKHASGQKCLDNGLEFNVVMASTPCSTGAWAPKIKV